MTQGFLNLFLATLVEFARLPLSSNQKKNHLRNIAALNLQSILAKELANVF
jgi:hypothetical protein